MTFLKILMWWTITSVTIIASLAICVFVMTKFPHTKLGTWIRNNIITNEDLEPPI